MIEKTSNEAVARLHLSTQHTRSQLSACLSVYPVSFLHLPSPPVRFSSNRNKKKPASLKHAKQVPYY
jgi:hypothetical protein